MCRLFAGLFTGHDPTRGSGQEGFKMSRVGSGRYVLKSRGSGWVGSGQDILKSRGSG